MTVDQRALLADLQKQVLLFEDDIRERAAATPEVKARLAEEHRRALEVGRTATGYTEWLDSQVTQAAVAWVLGTVFVRFCEDNRLIDDAWISGPGDRMREAGERQTQFLIDQPHLNDRDWLLAAFGHLAEHPAVAPLFNRDHNPLYRLEISADGTESLVAFWRKRGDDGAVVHDFTDAALSTRFLGDLYQDLSAAARKMYALLQTPEFVEELILDLTLDPAIDTFGLEDLKLIDPTCGSGHFLTGAFDRLLDRWTKHAPGMDLRERVQRSLDSIHGVDVNPFASAIAKFRLTVSALRASGLSRLKDAPGYKLHIGTGDSLLHGKADGQLFDSGLAHHQYASEDLDEHPSILKRGRYHVVVGNPPYITVKDKALNEAYRAGYDTCYRSYALSVPFAELFFKLAVSDPGRPGYVGQITSNSFMKREFGKKLVEEFFPRQDLTHVIDTSGAYIPGHGTPTVILVGRRRIPRTQTLRAVLGIRGEPSAPGDPAKGSVWRSIVEHLTEPGFENAYISVSDLPRDRLNAHPWSLAGGGADELKAIVESDRTRLGQLASAIGYIAQTNADDAFFADGSAMTRAGVEEHILRDVAVGDAVRDFRISEMVRGIFPYQGARPALAEGSQAFKYLWPNRTILGNRATFSRLTYFTEGRPWFEWHQVAHERLKDPRSLTYAFVATHNHFVFDQSGQVGNRSAPVVKLPESATEDDHLALLGVLNSSTACFWLKQVSHNKGSTVDQRGARQTTVDWENFYEFTGTKLNEFPLPDGSPLELVREMEEALLKLWHHHPRHHAEFGSVGDRDILLDAQRGYAAARARMVSLQEEMDWAVYWLYGLVEEDLSCPVHLLPGVELGHRAFEIALARKVAAGEADDAWFTRHRSKPTTEIPDHWPGEYRELVQRRLDLLESHPHLTLLERPECKRRWASDPWDVMVREAQEGWLLDRLENEQLWRDSAGRPVAQSIAQLTDRLAADQEFLATLELWAGRTISDVAAELGRLVGEEHVPFLAAHRYKPSGLRKRAEWEQTWDLQRREDAREDVGTIPVPAKYVTGDFLRTSYWRNRGKLDVPKERFISYPGAERGADATLVLGWAGWDHAEQAMALATLALNRAQQDGWDAVRLTPLLAGITELEPWVHQWHADVDPRMGMSPAQAVTATLEQQLTRLGLTREDLTAWRPEPTTRGRRRKTKED
ncbi:BREX-2 system adenine-specific DNA-methyltransferase PglX [Nocardioides sp. WL0053]|uniref:site-specific DNA-methyltransferase (adenine-specific) n=1 Tax=Nocardioides jiangsuensis TaxID=2866161 RepID=A0ABS7RQT8_9ACTN|nr:BREX-2 system adenine-specific DNA-methyltransferase PglX [Nocardioides jiangsuensis]MBY9075952.1 BREX-2 system adenine-specific DNA-methyltransferase PglX [Nocardioides jiangsuensis]